MSTPEVISPNFTKIAENIPGAEGPVFDKQGNFYMVAPEKVDKDGNAAGEILKVDLGNGKVGNHLTGYMQLNLIPFLFALYRLIILLVK